MKRFLNITGSSEFVRFLITGGFSALVNVGLCYVLTPLLGYRIAIVVAYLGAMTVAWILARFLVFSMSNGTPLLEYIRFSLVNAISLTQVWLVSVGLEEYFFPVVAFEYYSETIAHTIGVVSPVVPSYIGHKFFTFKN